VTAQNAIAMKLLPYSFKRLGLFIAPLGFALWVFMQRGGVINLLVVLFGEHGVVHGVPYFVVNVTVAVISFFSFLFGLYFIAFSNEKVEDEMIQQLRMESFQFAAAMQLIVIVGGFLAMAVSGEPEAEGMMMFFVAVVLCFWLSFIARFHSTLRARLK
jgi:ABC-type spermidine/putrescine transport system permease subunit I